MQNVLSLIMKTPRSTNIRSRAVALVARAAPSPPPRSGFRYDASYQRWVKDSRIGEVESSLTVVQPKSGPAYTVWPVMHADLSALPLISVPSVEVAKLQQEGWTIVDARVAADYDAEHIAGSVSVPLYRSVQGNERFDIIKRLAMGAMGMKATERNPEFAEMALRVLGSKSANVIVVCDIGGTLSSKREVAHKVKTFEVKDKDRAFGRESRSLKAAHALYEAGFRNMKHLEGGIQMWRHLGFPMSSTSR